MDALISFRNENLVCAILLLENGCLRRDVQQNYVIRLIIDFNLGVFATSSDPTNFASDILEFGFDVSS